MLFIQAIRYPTSSYTQDINDLVTLIVLVFLSYYYNGNDITTTNNILDEMDNIILDEIEANTY